MAEDSPSEGRGFQPPKPVWEEPDSATKASNNLPNSEWAQKVSEAATGHDGVTGGAPQEDPDKFLKAQEIYPEPGPGGPDLRDPGLSGGLK